MKRLLFFAALIVAIGSIGGNILTVHAQTVSTLTPTQTATLEQELAVAKATLVNLEQQAGMVPAGDSGTATAVAAQPVAVVAQPVVVTAPSISAASGLTANEVSAFQSTLNTLAATLTQLNGSLAVNSTLTPAQQQTVQGTLNGMQSTLVAMATSISNDSAIAGSASASAPIAAAKPSNTPVAVNAAPATPTTAPTTPVVAAAQPAPAVNAAAPQTAQVSSFWSFTKAHWPTIVIVLLVIAILAILFWPEKEKAKTISAGNSGSGKPKSAPTSNTTASLSHNITSNPAVAKSTMNSSSDVHAPATPMSNAVAAPSQK